MTLQEADSPISTATGGSRPRVAHFVDALGGGDRLWGKENVIVSLMHAQRESGRVQPELITFTPGLLADTMRAAGFPVHYLDERKYRNPLRALPPLDAILAAGAPVVLHTHEYKANIVARLARLRGTRMRKLVATAHGWVDSTPALELYFALDRWSAPLSDAVTVTDPAMLARFGRLRPRSLSFIPNAVLDAPLPAAAERAAARARFGFAPDAFVLGSLGRLTKNKGILDILAAAERTRDTGIVWAIAGSGEMSGEIERRSLPNVRFVGYQTDNAAYLRALDGYVQASYYEGLSLSLLEAMRGGLPCIATRAGATDFALRNAGEAVLLDAGDVAGLAASALRLQADPALAGALGAAARRRFDEAFAIARQHEAFLRLYLA